MPAIKIDSSVDVGVCYPRQLTFNEYLIQKIRSMQLISNKVLSRSLAFILLPVFIAACTAGIQSPKAPDLDSDRVLADTGPEPTVALKITSGSITSETPPEALPTHTRATTSILPDLGPAPDITNQVWLNSDKPLTLADLQGKVVLVEFWTFG